MLREQIKRLKQEYTDQYVTVAENTENAAELAELQGCVGQIKTIDRNGHALIWFEGPHQGCHVVDLQYLKVVDKPESMPADDETGWPHIPDEPESTIQLSRLELARLEKKAVQMAEEALANTAPDQPDKDERGDND